MVSKIWELFKISAAEWWNDNTFRLSASLAFYTIFSIAPILVIAMSVAATVFDEAAARAQIVSQMNELVGEDGGEAVDDLIQNARMTGGGFATAMGVILLLIGSTAVFAELQSALNLIWDVKAEPKRGWIASLLAARLRSLVIVVSFGFLLLVSLIISAGLAAAQGYVQENITGAGLLWQIINFVVSLALVAIVFAMIYKYLPDVRLKWRDVLIGALVTAALFTLGKFLIGLYLGQMAVGSAYGAAGSFVVLLIWVYYSSLICFFGAEFTQVYARRYGSQIQPEPHAERIGDKPDTI
jgi:membrane protein